MEVAGGQPAIEVDIEPRANGRPICSGCRKKRPGYDKLATRRFEFVPLWNMAVFFVYAMRQVNCPTCGVVVERVPWAEGKGHLTTSYRWFLARWAKRLSWTDTAQGSRSVCTESHAQAGRDGTCWLIAFITEPGPIRKILTHLGKPFEPPPILPARGPPTDWGEIVRAHDDRAIFQESPDELPVIHIQSL